MLFIMKEVVSLNVRCIAVGAATHLKIQYNINKCLSYLLFIHRRYGGVQKYIASDY